MHVFRRTDRHIGYTAETIAIATSEILYIPFYHLLLYNRALKFEQIVLPGKYSDKFLEILLRTTF